MIKRTDDDQEGHTGEQRSPCNAAFTILDAPDRPWRRPKKVNLDIVDNQRHDL